MIAYWRTVGIWLVGCTAYGAPLFDEPLAELQLQDGAVLRAAVIKGYASSTVMVKHADGAQSVPYGSLPDEYRAQAEARRPAPKSPEQIAAEKKAAELRQNELQAQRAAAAKKRELAAKAELKRGVRLVRFESTSFPQIVKVELRNESANPQTIYASHFVGVDAVGIAYPGVELMARNGDSTSVTIPGGATISYGVVFRGTSHQPPQIALVRWE